MVYKSILLGLSPFFFLLLTHSAIAVEGDLTLEIQPPAASYRFEHIKPEKGLPSRTAQAILQDSQGFMWFGTFSGLFRWDGYRFKSYQHDPDNPNSLSADNIGTLFEDSNNIMWVGTKNGGLNRFDRSTGQFVQFRHNPNDPTSLSNNSVNVITEDKKGRLWIGTDGGLNYFNQEESRFIRFHQGPAGPEGLNTIQVQDIKSDARGHLWLGTKGNGLIKLDSETQHLDRFMHNPNNSNSLSHNIIWTIAIDHEGIIWAGGEDGLNRYDPIQNHFKHYKHDPNNPNSLINKDVSSIIFDGNGMLWIGSTGSGLVHFDPKKEVFTRFQHEPDNASSFKGIWVHQIYVDKTGTIWIATLSDGVKRLDRDATKFELYQHNPNDPNSLSKSNTWSVFEDSQEGIWIGTLGGGLNHFDPVTRRFQHFKNDPNDPYSLSYNEVYAITEDNNGDIWIGTRNGLNRFNRGSKRFTRYLHDPENPDSLSVNWISSLFTDRKGRVWIGSFGGGLNRFNRSANNFRHYRHNPNDLYSLSDNLVLAIVDDQAGNLWLATYNGGLNYFNPETETFTKYRSDPKRSDTISSDQITHLYLDDADTLWLATAAGLDKMDLKSKAIVHYRIKNGLRSNNIVSIAPDDKGHLWLGTHGGGGLSRFNIEKETFKNFSREDGLQGDDFAPQGALRAANGKLYFTGGNGFNAFHPAQFLDNPLIPPVVLTDFLVFNKSVAVGEKSLLNKVINETNEIVLSHKESVFSFEFAALNFRTPEKNRYAYKLEGFDQDWNYVDSSRRFANYTNLNPGIYTFQVKASNNDGLWNETGKKIKITIQPPWWNSWQFYLLCTVLGIGFLLYIYRSTTRRLEAERSAVKILQESEQQLREIASNVPGVIYQSLRKINGSYSFPYISEKSETIFDVPAKQVIENADRMFERIFEDDLDEVVKSIDSSAKTLSIWKEEFRVRHTSGKVNWIQGRSVPHMLENGDVLWNGVLLDITEQKQADDALKESEEKYRKVVDNSIEGICVIQDDHFKYFNSRVIDLFGYSAEELNNMTTDVTIFPDDLLLVASIKNTQIQGNQPIKTYSHRIVTKDGRVRWVEVKSVTIVWEKQPAILVFLTDITERKRTNELIVQTEKMMSVGGLAAGMAHEINNPLGAILLSAQNMKRRLSPDLKANHAAAAEAGIDLHNLQWYLHKRAITNLLDGIQKSGIRAANIISNMLQFSRKSESNMAPTNLAKLIENVLELSGTDYNLKKKYDFRNIEITREFDASLPLVPCIETELEQVMLNIVTNSAWAMARNESNNQPSIIIRLGAKDKMAHIEVEDNGPGMDEETRKRIFEPFYTTKPVGEGTGLGLSVSYMIITNNHKGSIEVESKPGIGTKFMIRLPLHQE